MKLEKDDFDFLKDPEKLAKKSRARKPKKKPAKVYKSDLVMVMIKMSPADKAALVRKAKRIADGNLSALLRYSGLKYVPKPGEKVRLRAA